jgi:dolichyl-phosphate-mannose-protein mannosyltransferase
MLTLCSYKPEQTFLQFLDEWEFIIAPVIFTFFAFFTRMYKIGLSPIVTWDEAQYEDPSSALQNP